MRVLQVVHGFPPWAMGGTEVYTEALSKALAPKCEVFVLAREADPSLPEYGVRTMDRDGLRLTVVNNTFAAPRSFEDSYRQPPIRSIAARLLDEIRPDVVHVQHLTCLSTDIPFECARRGIPVVFTLHDYWMICHRGQLLDEHYRRCAGPYPAGCGDCVGSAGGVSAAGYRARAILRRVGIPIPAVATRVAERIFPAGGDDSSREASAARLAHMREVCDVAAHFLAPSFTLRDRFLEFGLPESRIAFHELGIDQSALAASEKKHGARLRIGFLGSMMISKGPHLLLEAFAHFPVGQASLHVYGSHAAYHGDDSYRARLEPLLDQPGLEWSGPVAHERIPEVFASLDVVVVPSVWLENSPLVIREAFAAGVPVVASNLGGMAELVAHEESGLLFEAGSVEGLTQALARLLEEPDLLPQLRRGIPAVRTIEDDAEATLAIYERLASGERG